MSNTPATSVAVRRGERARWFVHLALLLTFAGSLVALIYLSHSVTLHVVVGLAFVALVAVHLVQRRRTALALAKQLVGRGRRRTPSTLAVSDSILEVLVVNVLVSGAVDGLTHHETDVPFASAIGLPPGLDQWHKLSGLVLAVYVIVHFARRWRRLRRSHVR